MPQTPNDSSENPARYQVLGRWCLVLLMFALLAVAAPAKAEKGKPLAVKDVMELLQGGVPSSRIAQIVAEEGITFSMFDELEKRFRDTGATQELIDALKKASKPQQPDQPQPGRSGILKVQSKPGEAQVYLNDEPKGMTSTSGELRMPGLAGGTYRLRVSLAGYQSWENNIRITPGETESVFVTLVQKAVQPTVSLYADRPSIVAGQSLTLTWSSAGATDVDIEPTVGKVAASGSTTVSPRDSTTYTMTAIGPGGVNTATTHVTVTAPAAPPAPAVGTLPNFPIAGARVEEMKFFESGYDSPELGKRTYQSRFDHRSTRYVNWELDLACPAIPARVDFSINAIWYNPDGTVFANQNMNTYALPTWTTPVFNFGRGWKASGNWKTGWYRVELFVNGNRIATGSFEVY
jgi:PEGA domain